MADPGLVNGRGQVEREDRGAEGTTQRCAPLRKKIKFDLKYSTSGAFWALFPVQLAGLNAI